MNSLIKSFADLAIEKKLDVDDLCNGFEQMTIGSSDKEVAELCNELEKMEITNPNVEIYRLLTSAVKMLETKRRCSSNFHIPTLKSTYC